MFKKLFSGTPLSTKGITSFMRMVIGIFMIYHGWEVFDREPIATYTGWLVDCNFPSPEIFAYLGVSCFLYHDS